MKTIGIIGGMGPEATNHLILKIIKGFEEAGQKSRPNILVDFVPVSIETESNLILNNDPGIFGELLTSSAIRLENGGADFIVIACNSVHLFITDIRKSVGIPIISVIDEVAKLNLDNAGIIATGFTIKNEIFGNLFRVPSNQKSVNRIIDCLVKGKEVNTSDVSNLESSLDNWVQSGTKNCILGCSEMQLLTGLWNKWSAKINFVDTMDVLAQTSIKNLLN